MCTYVCMYLSLHGPHTHTGVCRSPFFLIFLFMVMYDGVANKPKTKATQTNNNSYNAKHRRKWLPRNTAIGIQGQASGILYFQQQTFRFPACNILFDTPPTIYSSGTHSFILPPCDTKAKLKKKALIITNHTRFNFIVTLLRPLPSIFS